VLFLGAEFFVAAFFDVAFLGDAAFAIYFSM
jgi:hypothetical protein